MMNTLRRLRIQYASDLHLEIGTHFVGPALLKPVAPILVLAGDIGRPDKQSYHDIMKYCSRSWASVIIVAGNHEFYNTQPTHPTRKSDTVDERLALIRSTVAEFPNVHFLERERMDIQGVAFLGCTLWTNAMLNAGLAQSSMNDYRLISNDGVGPVTPAETTAWHMRDQAWLTTELAACAATETPAVVVTHHLPSYDFIASRYAGSPMNFCFASSCDYLLRPPVRAWIAGHTHTAVHRHWTVGADVIHGVVNPRGYPGETGTGYCREIFVDVSTEPVICSDERLPELVAAAATS
jgi:hypothetical protein